MRTLILLFTLFHSSICLSQPVQTMEATIFVVDQNGLILIDGNMTQYHSMWSNYVDINDAWKLTNPGMNFGISRNDTNLVIERRSFIQATDTTCFRIWNMLQLHYVMRFVCTGLNQPGRVGRLYDSYTGAYFNIGLNDTTYYNFEINGDPATSNEYRFKVVFTPPPAGGSLPVTMTGVQANRSRSAVQIKWNVEGEIQMKSYDIERSSSGANFTSISQIPAINSSIVRTYDYTDVTADKNVNFYRIKALGMDGKVQYSPVAKVGAVDGDNDINIYPNPVLNKTVQVQYTNQPAGNYNLVLVYNNGMSQRLSTLQFGEGQGSKSVQLPFNLPSGSYYLKFIGPGNITTVKQIQVL